MPWVRGTSAPWPCVQRIALVACRPPMGAAGMAQDAAFALDAVRSSHPSPGVVAEPVCFEVIIWHFVSTVAHIARPRAGCGTTLAVVWQLNCVHRHSLQQGPGVRRN